MRNSVIDQGLRSSDAAALAGVSYRQIDYWARTGLLHPDGNDEGQGTHRSWPPREVQLAWVLGRLSRQGARLPKHLDGLRNEPDCLLHGFLVWDGHTDEPWVTGTDRLGQEVDKAGSATVVALYDCPIGRKE